MKQFKPALLLSLILSFTLSHLQAGEYYVLCEGNFGQANASLWSIDDDLNSIEGPLLWNTSSNPLGDVGQSLTLFNNDLYVVMNGSHEIRVVNLESGVTHLADIELPDTSPRYLAVHAESGRGYVSSWTLGGLIIIDLESNTPVDTFFVGGLPEQMLIVEDEMFVSMSMRSDWSASNQVLRVDLAGESPVISQTYEVIDGPGALALLNNQVYVTSIYYNDAWETFSGTSRINLADHTVLSVDHGLYTNYTADMDIIGDVVHRTFGTALVPLNDDLSLNTANAIGDVSGIYTHKVANDHILMGTSDFVAPDLVSILSSSGEELASFNVGALPSEIIYYAPVVTTTAAPDVLPLSLSLGSNYPNPFNPTTRIPFTLAKAGQVTLRIFDITGKAVATLYDGYAREGHSEIVWNGTNDAGVLLSSGIYHVVLATNFESASLKINLLK